ncbi:MAG: hypothetical protein WC763_00955 [Candidatus Paceibacterota bacterium]|jgi:hypothetical protein
MNNFKKTIALEASIVGLVVIAIASCLAFAPYRAPSQAFDPRAVAGYFGNEASGDLTGDGRDDRAFLVTRDEGGSGTFYYAIVAIATSTSVTAPQGYYLTNPFLVGDRIAPQSTEINASARELHVNYAERNPGEPMTTSPSRGAVLLLKVTSAGVLEGLMR